MKKISAILFVFVCILMGLNGCSTIENNIDKGGSEDNIAFSNVILSDDANITTVNGEVKNNDSKAHSFTLKVTFYDENNKLLGTATGAVNDINGGDTKLFSAIANGEYSNAASYKIQVDTMVSSEANKENTIEFSNTVANTVSNMTTISGEAKNVDSKEHSFTLKVGAYDDQGKLIGVATGSINDLAAGDTKTFSAVTTDDLSVAKTYTVYVDTVVE